MVCVKMNSDHVRLNLHGNQLYQPLNYIVPLPIFSIRVTVINLEDVWFTICLVSAMQCNTHS